MKIKEFLKGKIMEMVSAMLLLLMVWMLGYAFHVQSQYLTAVTVLSVVLVATNISAEYWKKRRFYKDFLETLERLDQKYLITEMLSCPEFVEGEILYDALYEIDKSMKERINAMENVQRDFREYVELWIHEIKVPIATLSCMNYNENLDLLKQKQQVDKLNYYVEQILFLSRADNSQKDYLMKQVSLDEVVNQVIRNNKELILGNRIRIEKESLDSVVTTDAKWLEFMVGQIVNNSVKYLTKSRKDSGERPQTGCEKENRPAVIRFEVLKHGESSELVITDNGIGIPEEDLPRVFEKTFTGKNGRKVTGATGMGLYICRKLCDKLGHALWIESEEGSFTRVHLEFGKDDFYQMEK